MKMKLMNLTVLIGGLFLSLFVIASRCLAAAPSSAAPQEGSKRHLRSTIRWVIIIIETPHGLIILDKNSKEPNTFKPESLMVLAATDGTVGDVGNWAEGINPLTGAVTNISKISQGTTKELAKMMKEGMANQRRAYSVSCFNEFDQADAVKMTPEEASETFGTNNVFDIIHNGPVIACGSLNKENTLAIYDASGVLVQTINKDQINDNPNIIEESLDEAARLSEEFFKDDAKDRVVHSKEGISDSTGGDGPNDLIYIKQKKEEKQKLFGIFGSNDPVTEFGGLSFGTGVRRKSTGPKRMGAGKNREGPDIQEQWGIRRVGYLPYWDPNSAWNYIDGKEKNVIVAVIDSGIDMVHPDSPAYFWRNEDEIERNGLDDDKNGYVDDIWGWNFANENGNLADLKGHGTFVSGIIAAKRNNGIGIAGINPGAVIMVLKVTNKEGQSNALSIFRAIFYAVENGAQIINISSGGRGFSRITQNAINYAHANGVLVVVSSGNNGNYLAEISPAALHRALVIGAIDYNGQRSTISSYGPNNGLVAPGELIASIFPRIAKRDGVIKIEDERYHRMSGTSFSAPIVTATASLLLARYPGLSDYQLIDRLVNTTRDNYEKGWDDKTGAGLLDARGALQPRFREDMTVIINRIDKNMDKKRKKKIASVDVYVTVRGKIKEFVIEVGKGKDARKFKQVAGPFSETADHDWVVRISSDDLRGAKRFTIQLRATNNDGRDKLARSILHIKK